MRADTIDDFPLPCKKFLRYGLWRPQTEFCLGSVLVLADYGHKLEDMAQLATQLTGRGFYVVTFEWFPHDQTPHGQRQDQILHDLPAPLADFRVCVQNLKDIFFRLFLTQLPPPFYGFGIGLGALFGLAANNVLRSQMRRMMLVSPLMAPNGHKAGGLFHQYSRFMSDLGLAGWRTNQPIVEHIAPTDPLTMARQAANNLNRHFYPTLGCYQGMLDAAQLILSPRYREEISIPFLCVLSSTDQLSSAALARQFCESLRCAAAITLHHAERFPFDDLTAHGRQFWRAFDAFIPGTGAPNPDRSLEDGIIL